MRELYIGLMSGTSLDGVDAVLVEFAANDSFVVRAAHSEPYPASIRQRVLALQNRGHDELHQAALLANQLADLYAQAIRGVLLQAGLEAQAIRAVGCHGQTIRHAPQDGYTLQIGNLARLAEHCAIDVIGDFRSRDVAAGGQGAPLVPAFHQAAFAHPSRARVVVNIGGISNLTVLVPGEAVFGFDCGPGNMLLDAWCQRHLGQPYDQDGQWAASGQVIPSLLAQLLAEPFFAAPPPKSTGRDLFDLAWLEAHLSAYPALASADVQATLLAQCAQGIADAILRYAESASEIFLCGGGAHNACLVQALAGKLPGRQLMQTAELDLPAQWVEATAFAWLARQTCLRQPGNLPAATGAQGLRVLGAIYPR